ncbi:hypothetical protein BB560_000254 [Smittium megazygosporum]|uniref:Endoribonuclease YSH1 n=1 Tax=Smittium megazygosporum TaxID=133381 RepID=A0A2T9ZKW6_9FUNG|nr:hypothetical protein BB560_000254 [Smittium megazygosporum]
MKHNIEIPVENDQDLLKIKPLGAGQEVGRSCIVIEYKNKTVMLDCGLHPAYDGLASLPFFDEIDPASVDVLLVTHFHVDHAAAVPYFLEKTDFSGRTFMTHPTKAIFRWLLSDYVRVSNSGSVSDQDILYNEQDMANAYSKIEVIDYHQQIEINGIKFSAYNAGHVLGAAMFVVEIAGIKILYTGDYSREEDRHLMAAENPREKIDIMITESTYGVQSFEPRIEKEARFTKMVSDVVLRGGRCLMPVFALGRTQELLLILEEFWNKHKELEPIPIYFASALAKRCMLVYQTYIHMMNSNIQKLYATSNPFIFKHISYLTSVSHFDDVGPCVMLASPGMLQSGVSREFFDKWAPDRRNGLILTGYSVEGTLARAILSEPAEVTTLQGLKIPRRMTINYISFSAHVDYTQNSEFIDLVSPSSLVLVHGEQGTMNRLKSALSSRFIEKQMSVTIYTPRNTESVRLYFRGEKIARMIGKVAVENIQQDSIVEGILVEQNYSYNLYSSLDLNEFEGIKEVPIKQMITVPYYSTLSLLLFHLQSMYGFLDTKISGDKSPNSDSPVVITIFDSVQIIYTKNTESVDVQWVSSTLNDMVADSVMALLLNIDSSPASVKITSESCSGHTHTHTHIHKPDIENSGLVSGKEETKEFLINSIPENFCVNKDADTEMKEAVGALGDYTSDISFLGKENFSSITQTFNYSRIDPSFLKTEIFELLSEQFPAVEFSKDGVSLDLISEANELPFASINTQNLVKRGVWG